MPDVVTLPPLIAVVPLAFVVKLAAFTVPLKVVVPVLFNAIAPNAVPTPALPVRVIAPAPALIVNARAEALEIVDPKLTKLSVVFNTVSAPSAAAPYDCVPLLVTLPLLNVTA